jgi:hypothetical protein
MNCSRARKFLPLYAGADLSAGKARRLERHLERCSSCRKESGEFRDALAGIRAVAGRDALDWPEGEWKSLMARVRSAKQGPRHVPDFRTIPRKAWATGFAAVLVLGAAALILRGLLSPPATPLLSEILTATSPQPSRTLTKDEVPSGLFPQDVPFRVQRERRALDRVLLAAAPVPEKTTQKMMSMTLVSQETGLKVHWTFNRNFEWEEKKQ